MTAALYILHIVDDFGNRIAPSSLSEQSYYNRYTFFKEKA